MDLSDPLVCDMLPAEVVDLGRSLWEGTGRDHLGFHLGYTESSTCFKTKKFSCKRQSLVFSVLLIFYSVHLGYASKMVQSLVGATLHMVSSAATCYIYKTHQQHLDDYKNVASSGIHQLEKCVCAH